MPAPERERVVPVALVKVVPCNEEIPETVRLPPKTPYPVLERLVPEALVKFKVGKRP